MVFNIALVQGSRHAEPAVLGVAVACVARLGASRAGLLTGWRPPRPLVWAGIAVVAGGLTLGLRAGTGNPRTHDREAGEPPAAG